MTTETIDQKARRYLTDGRIVVTRVLGDTVDAVCQGDTGSWELGHRRSHGWFCSCPVRGRCSHLAGLWLITVRHRSPDSEPPATSQADRSATLDPAA